MKTMKENVMKAHTEVKKLLVLPAALDNKNPLYIGYVGTTGGK
jgi:hypothetical protein